MEAQRAFLSAVSSERQKSWNKVFPSFFFSLLINFIHDFVDVIFFSEIKSGKIYVTIGYAE